jgi:hypothetical protein
MLFPFLSNGTRLKVSFASQALLIQQTISPVTEWAAKPGIDWHSEPHLGPVHQSVRDIFPENLSEYPLGLAITPAELGRQGPDIFDNAMIYQRYPRLKRYCHARTIHFCKDIIGQIGDSIEVLHPLYGIEKHAREIPV